MPNERPMPYVSVNKLGEYLVASAARRRTILRDQKRPRTFKVSYYGEAENPVIRYLIGDATGADLAVTKDRLYDEPVDSEWDGQRKSNCAEAIEAFLDLTPDLDFQGLELSRADSSPPKLPCGGVEISVRPEITLSRNGAACGFLKICFMKDALPEPSALYVATTLHQFAETNLGGDADRRSCLVLDVFGSALYEAPNAFRRRRQDIQAACEEIAARWDRI